MAALFFFGYREPTLYLRTHSMKKTPLVVRKAVLPVAGLGTRMLPATKAIPFRDAARGRQAADPVWVRGNHRRRHQGDHPGDPFKQELHREPLRQELELGGDPGEAGQAPTAGRGSAHLVPKTSPSCTCVRGSKRPRSCSTVCPPLIGDQPFAVLLPDVLIDEVASDLKQDNLAEMVHLFEEEQISQIMVEAVPEAKWTNTASPTSRGGPERRHVPCRCRPSSRSRPGMKPRRTWPWSVAMCSRPISGPAGKNPGRRRRRDPADRCHRHADGKGAGQCLLHEGT